jgi:hypothetical protein
MERENEADRVAIPAQDRDGFQSATKTLTENRTFTFSGLMMRVKIDVNKMKSGRAQIAMFRDGQSNGFVQTYPSLDDAKGVLLMLGLPPERVLRKIDLLTEDFGPEEPLTIAVQDIPDDLIRQHGFSP